MSSVSHAPRPDLEAYERSARLDFSTLVDELNELLGPKLVAYIAGVQEARTVRQWIVAECDVRAPVPDRLRLAFQVASRSLR